MTIAYKAIRVHHTGKYVSSMNHNPETMTGCIKWWKGKKDRAPSRVYRIGHITKAPKGSLGIFCFSSLDRAKKFIGVSRHEKVLVVEGIGDGTVPRLVDSNCDYPRFQPPTFFRVAPMKDTICFPAVRVIEEVK